MSISPTFGRTSTSRFKSSELLKKIIQQSRDLHKQHHSRLLVLKYSPHTKSSLRSQLKPKSQLTLDRSSELSPQGSQSAIKHINILTGQESILPRSSSQHSHNKTCQKNLKFSSIRDNFRKASPEFFRKALYSILKVPLDRPAITKKRQLKKS